MRMEGDRRYLERTFHQHILDEPVSPVRILQGKVCPKGSGQSMEISVPLLQLLPLKFLKKPLL